MPKINITDGYFNRLTKDQLKDFMSFVLFSNVAGLQYESALFKALLFKLELPPLEVTVVEEQPQRKEREVKSASEVKKEKEQEKGEEDESKGEEDK